MNTGDDKDYGLGIKKDENIFGDSMPQNRADALFAGCIYE